ncbi:MAG: hypothetical protein KC593_17345 [Myxococcales bacterium]|nr:hypothetical protein [Myxococcales bacterium]
MFSPKLRLVLMVACLGFAAMTAQRDPTRAAVLVALAGLLAYGALRLGGVPAAFAALRRNDLANAKRLLDQTNPRFLNAECRAKRAWVLAALAEAAGDLPAARAQLEAALAGAGLTRKAERGIALATLAAVEHRLGSPARGRELLDEAAATSASPEVQRLVEKLRAEPPAPAA